MAFVPSTAAETQQWLLRFHAANDSLNIERLPTIYAKDVRMQFGNMPVIRGLDAVSKHLESIWQNLASMHHEIDQFDLVGDDKIYQSCHISWQVKGDPEEETVVVPAMAVLHILTTGEEKGLIQAAEFYMDASPLLAVFSRVG